MISRVGLVSLNHRIFRLIHLLQRHRKQRVDAFASNKTAISAMEQSSIESDVAPHTARRQEKMFGKAFANNAPKLKVLPYALRA